MRRRKVVAEELGWAGAGGADVVEAVEVDVVEVAASWKTEAQTSTAASEKKLPGAGWTSVLSWRRFRMNWRRGWKVVAWSQLLGVMRARQPWGLSQRVLR